MRLEECVGFQQGEEEEGELVPGKSTSRDTEAGKHEFH